MVKTKKNSSKLQYLQICENVLFWILIHFQRVQIEVKIFFKVSCFHFNKFFWKNQIYFDFTKFAKIVNLDNILDTNQFSENASFLKKLLKTSKFKKIMTF